MCVYICKEKYIVRKKYKKNVVCIRSVKKSYKYSKLCMMLFVVEGIVLLSFI